MRSLPVERVIWLMVASPSRHAHSSLFSSISSCDPMRHCLAMAQTSLARAQNLWVMAANSRTNSPRTHRDVAKKLHGRTNRLSTAYLRSSDRPIEFFGQALISWL